MEERPVDEKTLEQNSWDEKGDNDASVSTEKAEFADSEPAEEVKTEKEENRDLSSHSSDGAYLHDTPKQEEEWLPWAMQSPVEGSDPAATRQSLLAEEEQPVCEEETRVTQVSRPAELEQTSPEKRPKKKKHRGLYTFIRVVVGVLVIGAVSYALAATILTGVEDFLGFNRTEYTVEIEIDKDDTIEDVAAKLVDNEVIRWQWFFEFMSGREDDIDIRRGTHTFHVGASYSDIWIELGVSEEVHVTIVEGMSAVQIADLLEESQVCDADEFLKALETETFQFEFFSGVKEDSLKYYQMEGYLFPETYYFEIDMKPREALRMFYIETENIYVKYKEQIEASGMTFEEVLTLASIIEKEAGDGGEMPTISSVFHNRLNNDEYPNLQSDYTIFYVENYIKPYINPDNDAAITAENQPMYDVYNTYVCQGLPIGPIANPGEIAIKAALEPEATNYLYFVHNLHTGECYFSSTLEEHEANVERAETETGE